MSELKLDPIPTEARAALELFGQELREVRFPDLDGALLEACAQEVRDAQLEVECIEAALEQARAVVRERAQVLALKAQRALSYARIFAADNEELSTRIAELDGQARPAPSSSNAEPGKKRGRPRKGPTEAGLFEEPKDEEVAA